MLRPPNPRLACNETITVIKQVNVVGPRGGVTQTAGVSTTYTGFATKVAADARSDAAEQILSRKLYDVMIFSSVDPGVSEDDDLTSSLGMSFKALGDSFPRETGCYKVECQVVE